MPGDDGGERRWGTLWLVATPIGSLGDLAPRAREVLEGCDVILAEDTRRARKLLSAHDVSVRGRLRSLHEHNESRRVGAAVAELGTGLSLAVVSDAGTPVLSDPGFELVRAARRAGCPVRTVPGPTAFTAALAASGQPPLPATLVGFLPPRRGARRRRLEELAEAPWTLVVLMSPHRLRAEVEDVAGVLGGGRPATLLAELSKRNERAVHGTLGEVAESSEVARPRGEYVLVVGPAETPAAGPGEVTAREARRAYDEEVRAGADRRTALRRTAEALGVPRNTVYELLLEPEDGE